MHKLLLLIILGLFSPSFAQAQQYQHANKSLPCLNRQFSIIVHIVKNKVGVPAHSLASINEGVDELNKYFKPICTSFNVCEVRFIPNFQYLKLLAEETEWKEMDIKYHAKNRINVYYIENAGGLGGFAELGGIANMTVGGIVLSEPSALTHEMGHFFGLLHTFETGNELVDGSNCATAGDFICDTPADPNEKDKVSSDCVFTGVMKDANGQYYTPDIGNIMSYYPKSCRCGFTSGQLRKMVEVYLASSPKMW